MLMKRRGVHSGLVVKVVTLHFEMSLNSKISQILILKQLCLGRGSFNLRTWNKNFHDAFP